MLQKQRTRGNCIKKFDVKERIFHYEKKVNWSCLFRDAAQHKKSTIQKPLFLWEARMPNLDVRSGAAAVNRLHILKVCCLLHNFGWTICFEVSVFLGISDSRIRPKAEFPSFFVFFRGTNSAIEIHIYLVTRIYEIHIFRFRKNIFGFWLLFVT